MLAVNRGAAYMDGRLFRGTQDGRVLAYDAKTGKRLWERRIADPKIGESVPAAPAAWNGLVFAGNAGGDNYGVKGRMYALDAKTGEVKWEFYLVPKDPPAGEPAAASDDPRAKTWGNEPGVPIAGGATWTTYTVDPASGLLYVPGGNPAPDFKPNLRPGTNEYANSIVVLDAKSGEYRRHWGLVEEDFHDWDVSAAPAIVRTKAGAHRLLVAPKDGYLYGIDLASGDRVFRTAVTTIENAEAPLTPEGTRFCPGAQGGSEWNGPAYDPDTNLVFTGATDWCTTVRVAPDAEVKSVSYGQPWSGSASEKKPFGKQDPIEQASGWLVATDADTGKVAWRYETPLPILAGVTPTAGGLVFAADMEGNFFAFDKKTGKVVHQRRMDGAIGGGLVTYESNDAQRIAVAVGMTSPIWPAPKITARIVVLGLPDEEADEVAANDR